MKNNDFTPLELYIHIPFCVRKCLYCDFLSGPSDEMTRQKYVQALLAEIKSVDVSDKYEVVSIFIGGGTPSILAPKDIALIMKVIRAAFRISDSAEITIEANPGTVDESKLKTYLDSGINRLSLGLQSTDDAELKSLGRIHSYDDFLESYHLARLAGFKNINVDLMFAIPNQSLERWRDNLYKAARLKPEHISAYSLIVEEGTPFYKLDLSLPDEDTEYQMYEDTAKIMMSYGYHQYEISNYAKQGYECRHNIGYWRRTEYLGLGLGAASLYDGVRFSNTDDMDEYLKISQEPQKLRKQITKLTLKDQMEEFMYLGLRMTEGVSEADFVNAFGKSLEDVYGDVLRKYESTGFLQKTNSGFKFTRKGIHVSNHILADFLLDD